jgi:23S rRNA (adenine2030-N6)-methyltransferase
MNYRHSFHAGNFADVLKHLVLLAILGRLTAKDKPLTYVETHAGAGRYRLAEPNDERPPEYAAGIAALLRARPQSSAQALAPLLETYLSHVRSFNGLPETGRLLVYPGSPLLASAALRADDRMLLCELVEEQAQLLTAEFRGDRRVQVHQRDGYAALKALLPPLPRRGLVLIDPPFEVADEYSRIVAALSDALGRWAQGVYAIWYPIKLRQDVFPLLRAVTALPVARVLNIELCVHADDTALRLNGSGMLILNPPYRLDVQLQSVLPALRKHLLQGRYGRCELRWLKGRDEASS